MSTFHLPSTNPSCAIHLSPDLTKDELLAFPPFKTWVNTLIHSLTLQSRQSHPLHADPYKLRSITIQAVDRFGSPPKQRLGFIKLTAELVNSGGETLPGSVFLRGGSVAMLVILSRDDHVSDSTTAAGDDEERYALLTVQARVPAGSLAFSELPAGMLDDAGTFAGTAAKEMEEELGLTVPAEELINMTQLAIDASAGISAGSSEHGDEFQEDLQAATYTSPGGQDEFMSLFLHRRSVPREQLDEWQGKLTGLRAQGEKITLRLVPLRELWREGVRDVKVLAACALYYGLRRDGVLS